MRVGLLFGKRTWIGFGFTMCLLIVVLLLGSLLVVREILPMDAVSPWLWIGYGLAVLIGGRIAAVGQGWRLCALMPGVMLYALIWVAALCSECTIDFSANGIGITIAIAVGTMIAFISGQKKKKHRSRKGSRPVAKTVRR